MTYIPPKVANGFLELGFRNSIGVDPMKLQKLMFFAQGYYVATTGKALLSEPFQAWKLGPVLPSIYHRVKPWGGRPITEYAEIIDPNLRRSVPAAPPEDDPAFIFVRDFVWESYGEKESIALSKLTHRAGGAWDRTLKANPGIQGPQIPLTFIKDEFDPLVTDEERQRFA